jgi:hypothetical protein
MSLYFPIASKLLFYIVMFVIQTSFYKINGIDIRVEVEYLIISIIIVFRLRSFKNNLLFYLFLRT